MTLSVPWPAGRTCAWPSGPVRFLGAAGSLLLLREHADWRLITAFALMAVGVWSMSL